MHLKILQLNMWAGTHFPAIESFLKENDFDILCLQEVSGPRHQGNVQVDIDCLEELQRVLETTHHVELLKSGTFTPTPDISYEGNAIFYKKELQLLSKDILWLFKRDTPFSIEQTPFKELGRTGLHLTLSKNNKAFHIITAHLAWAPTPTEQPYQREQNLKLTEYMKYVKQPWILAGDFNITPDQQSILDLEKLGKDLTKEYGIQNTIDPTIHTAWERIKPGFAVDYIFVSSDIQVEEFKALENVHLSDHLGLVATLSF